MLAHLKKWLIAHPYTSGWGLARIFFLDWPLEQGPNQFQKRSVWKESFHIIQFAIGLKAKAEYSPCKIMHNFDNNLLLQLLLAMQATVLFHELMSVWGRLPKKYEFLQLRWIRFNQIIWDGLIAGLSSGHQSPLVTNEPVPALVVQLLETYIAWRHLKQPSMSSSQLLYSISLP